MPTIFDRASLTQAIDDAVASVPDQKKVVVTVEATRDEGAVSFGVKTGAHVTLGGYARSDWGKGWTAGAKGVFSW